VNDVTALLDCYVNLCCFCLAEGLHLEHVVLGNEQQNNNTPTAQNVSGQRQLPTCTQDTRYSSVTAAAAAAAEDKQYDHTRQGQQENTCSTTALCGRPSGVISQAWNIKNHGKRLVSDFCAF